MKKDKSRVYHLLNYNLSPADYDKISEVQGGRCGITRTLPVNRRLNVDHNHDTGMVRGLLSGFANKFLGYAEKLAKDAKVPVGELLRTAAYYIENPPAVRALGEVRLCAPGRIKSKVRRKLIKKWRKDGCPKGWFDDEVQP